MAWGQSKYANNVARNKVRDFVKEGYDAPWIARQLNIDLESIEYWVGFFKEKKAPKPKKKTE